MTVRSACILSSVDLRTSELCVCDSWASCLVTDALFINTLPALQLQPRSLRYALCTLTSCELIEWTHDTPPSHWMTVSLIFTTTASPYSAPYPTHIQVQSIKLLLFNPHPTFCLFSSFNRQCVFLLQIFLTAVCRFLSVYLPSRTRTRFPVLISFYRATLC